MADDARPKLIGDDTARVLLDLSRELSELAGPAEIAARLAAAVPKVIPVDASTVLLVNRESSMVEVVGHWGWPDDLAEAIGEFAIPLDAAPIVRRAVEGPEPLYVTMDYEDPLVSAILNEFETDAAIVVPLAVRDESLGLVAGLQRGGCADPMSPDLVQRLQGIAEIAARAFDNARLYAALDDQQNVLTHVLESGPMVTFRATTQGWFVTYVSQNVRRMFGHDPESFLDAQWLAFVHPDDREHTWRNVLRVLDEAEVEFGLRFRDAADRWRHVRVNLRGDPDSPPDDREILGYVWDESERRQAEDRYRLLSELTSDLAYAARVDHEGEVIVDWHTGGVEELTGYTVDEMMARGGLPGIVVQEEVDRFGERRERLLAGEDVVDVYRVRTKSGEERWLELLTRPVGPEGNPTRFVGAVRDVTDRKRAEEALAESEAQLRQLVEESPTAIVATDARGAVTEWNPAAERVFGWAREEVLGVLPPAIPEGRLEAEIDRFESVFRARRRLRNVRTKALRKDGTVIDAVFSAAPVFDAGGNLAGVISVVEDVTERNRLEEELRQVQKMNAIGRLAGGVAHDFNNILTTILGHAEFLLDEPPEPESVRENAAAIRHAADRASALTEQLLMFSRRRVPQTEVLDLNDVVTSMHAMLERLIGEHIAFTVEHGVDPALVRASRSQLEQVVLNLVVNAGESMPEGGSLSLETFAATLGGEDAIGLKVSDSGRGMAPEVCERIFEPFFTTREGGVGLGLAVVYGIVDNADGEISVDSAPGKGTVFTIRLPRASAGAEDRPPVPSIAGSIGIGRILLVEDEAEVRSVAREALVRHGYEVEEAADALEALTRAGDEPGFDLLITDLVMPYMGGEELAQRLARRASDFRVLFVSGYSETIPDDADGEGRAFLQKPFTPDTLLAAVRRMLSETAPDSVG